MATGKSHVGHPHPDQIPKHHVDGPSHAHVHHIPTKVYNEHHHTVKHGEVHPEPDGDEGGMPGY